MSTIFTKIVKGEIPCFKIAENKAYFAFLDINPLHEGHTLIVPKIEEDYIFDLDDKTISGLFVFAKKIAKAIEKVVPCLRVGVSVVGIEVPHAHVHLIPFNTMSDLNFMSPKLKFSKEEMETLAQKIRNEIQ